MDCNLKKTKNKKKKRPFFFSIPSLCLGKINNNWSWIVLALVKSFEIFHLIGVLGFCVSVVFVVVYLLACQVFTSFSSFWHLNLPQDLNDRCSNTCAGLLSSLLRLPARPDLHHGIMFKTKLRT